MRILQIPEGAFPEPRTTPSATPALAPAPAPDTGRVDALETITQSILQRIQAIEERLTALEERPKSEVRSLTPEPKDLGHRTLGVVVSLDADALKKDLFAKMWKYLNDKAAA